jgi:hypothetical protein
LSDLPQNAEGVLLIVAAPELPRPGWGPPNRSWRSRKKRTRWRRFSIAAAKCWPPKRSGRVSSPSVAAGRLGKTPSANRTEFGDRTVRGTGKRGAGQRFAAITPSRITRNAPVIEMQHPAVLRATCGVARGTLRGARGGELQRGSRRSDLVGRHLTADQRRSAAFLQLELLLNSVGTPAHANPVGRAFSRRASGVAGLLQPHAREMAAGAIAAGVRRDAGDFWTAIMDRS